MTYPGIENDPQAAENPDRAAVEELRKAREAEFGVYVAVTDIPWGTVLAATPGTAIPASTVERYKWDELGLVAKRDSKAGREVLERTGTATTEEREKWAAADKAAAERAAAREAEKAAAAAAKATTAPTTAASAKSGTVKQGGEN